MVTVEELRVLITANNSQFVRSLTEAERKLVGIASVGHAFGVKMDRSGLEAAQQIGETANRISNIGLLASAILTGLSVRAAVQFESAFAGVRKTVEGTEDQFASLREAILDMSEVKPPTAAEISRVAEAAGQLGIHVDDIANFTAVMVDLGEATNLTADQAATTLAKLANITGLATEDFDRLGSTLVELGNKTAATEAEIANMALNLAAAGSQAGLTEPQILALAASLVSVGQEAEAGGSSVSRVIIEMQNAVARGGESLDQFATVAGISGSAFAAAFREDAMSALLLFVEGLARVQQSGGDTNAILEQMGFTDIRVGRAVRGLIGDVDGLSRAVKDGERAWRENRALQEEVARRYATTEARAEMLRNSAQRLAIDIGGALQPALEGVIGAAKGLAEILSQVDPILLGTTLITVGLTAAVVKLAAGIPVLVGSVRSLAVAFGALQLSAGAAVGVVAALALVIGGTTYAYLRHQAAATDAARAVAALRGSQQSSVASAEETREAYEKATKAIEEQRWQMALTAATAEVLAEKGPLDRAANTLFGGHEFDEEIHRRAMSMFALSQAQDRVAASAQPVGAALAQVNQQARGERIAFLTTEIERLQSAIGRGFSTGEDPALLNQWAESVISMNRELSNLTGTEAETESAAERTARALARQDGVTRMKAETTNEFRKRLLEAGFSEETVRAAVDDTTRALYDQQDGYTYVQKGVDELARYYRVLDTGLEDVTASVSAGTLTLGENAEASLRAASAAQKAAREAQNAATIWSSLRDPGQNPILDDAGNIAAFRINGARIHALQNGLLSLVTSTGAFLNGVTAEEAAKAVGMTTDAFLKELRIQMFNLQAVGNINGVDGFRLLPPVEADTTRTYADAASRLGELAENADDVALPVLTANAALAAQASALGQATLAFDAYTSALERAARAMDRLASAWLRATRFTGFDLASRTPQGASSPAAAPSQTTVVHDHRQTTVNVATNDPHALARKIARLEGRESQYGTLGRGRTNLG